MPLESNLAFTKLVVHDLEKQVAFYRDVYGLHDVHRVRAKLGDEDIEEVMMSPDPNATWSTLALLKYAGRAPSPSDELILGFTTSDLPALLERVQASGGRIHAPMREMPEVHIRVAFVRDPEGHMNELVQVLG